MGSRVSNVTFFGPQDVNWDPASVTSRFWLVSMIFQGGFMVFHGFWLVSMVFQGGFMVFAWFSWSYKVVSSFFMYLGWFSLGFMGFQAVGQIVF